MSNIIDEIANLLGNKRVFADELAKVLEKKVSRSVVMNMSMRGRVWPKYLLATYEICQKYNLPYDLDKLSKARWPVRGEVNRKPSGNLRGSA